MESGGKDLDFVLGKAAEGILKVKEQKESSTNHGDLDSSLAIFGVVKRARDNDMELHSDQQVMFGNRRWDCPGVYNACMFRCIRVVLLLQS